MLTTAARGGKSRPNGARPASTRGLPAQSCLSDCPASLIMIVLAERRRSRCQAPRWSVRMIMDVVEIQKYLPHRYPFLMVDGILEMERLKRIVGIKNVTAT